MAELASKVGCMGGVGVAVGEVACFESVCLVMTGCIRGQTQ